MDKIEIEFLDETSPIEKEEGVNDIKDDKNKNMKARGILIRH